MMGGNREEQDECVSTVLRLGHLGIAAAETQESLVTNNKNKKKRGRSSGGAQTDKTGPGLREISMKVREKVEIKGRTTYNEVAEELVAEYTDSIITQHGTNNNNDKESDSKTNNILRRVYDALNVLMAMDIITKDKKEVLWKGLAQPATPHHLQNLEWEQGQLIKRIEKKAAYLEELQEQLQGFQNLVHHNQQQHTNAGNNASKGGVTLPFVLLQTRPSATVEVEISEDMQLVHFDFNSTPFELHDDNYVLKQMRMCDEQRPQTDGE